MATRRIDPRLLEVLVCPLTKGPLRYDREAEELISERAQLAYPIKDGIPIMLADEARPLSEAERARARSRPPGTEGPAALAGDERSAPEAPAAADPAEQRG